jgi:exopolysaccharide biosynthesis WecB/TagA/CpsF family protein
MATQLHPQDVPLPVSTPPTVAVTGARLALIDYERTLDWIDSIIAARQRGYLCVCNVHTVTAAHEDAELRAALESSSFNVPDGQPLVWALAALGHPLSGRVYGPELMERACARAVEGTPRFYLYGGRNQGALVQLALNLRRRYPGINIVGGYAPPHRELTVEEEDAIVEEINRSQADVVWVGIGVPKQEKWMARMRGRLTTPVLVGVGAAFDFHAGLVPQAPPLLQRAGLEWAYRLSREPRRLWRRYLRYNPRFVVAFCVQLLRERRSMPAAAAAATVHEISRVKRETRPKRLLRPPTTPAASIVIPTHERPGYLDVALASIVPQANEHRAELIVVDDGPSAATRAAAERYGARYVAHEAPRGLNAARNTGLEIAGADLLVLVDDDIEARPGWLGALLAAHATLDPAYGVLAGRIDARFEDHPLRSCGRHGPPVTYLDLGPTDADAEFGWGANMAVRRTWLERVGWFDPALDKYGSETEWELRMKAAGGRVRYVAGAGVNHRRAGSDARLGRLMRAAYAMGREVRRFEASQGPATLLERELFWLAKVLVHIVPRRCSAGLVLAARNAGRIHEALRPARPAPAEDFLSGQIGFAAGRRARVRRAADRSLDALDLVTGRRRRAHAGARRGPRRRVLVVGAHHNDRPVTTPETLAELRASRHEVVVDVRDVGSAGKFENLNAILADHDVGAFDWVIAVDDDVELPRGFLDGFLHLAERHGLVLAQPAQTLGSHAAWPIVRRRALTAVRRTTFVEIGPVTAFSRAAMTDLTPFPPLSQGWGLELHWAAIAREKGWPMGIVDLLPVRHELRPVATGYSAERAIEEARAFLADRPYLRRDEVRTVAVHRRV